MFRALILVLLTLTYAETFSQNTKSWSEAKSSGQAQLNCFWFDSEPFIFPEGDSISGIEYELMIEFKRFIKNEHNVDLTLNFIEATTFRDLYDTIRNVSGSNHVGMASFSITAERSQQVDFTEPYLPDISVLISEISIPIAYNQNDFKVVFDQKKAITVSETTFEEQLISLRNRLNIDYEVEYLPSTSELIRKVANTPSSFGYIDLPSYLTALQDTVNVKRQYLYPLINPGLSFILPKNSNWTEVFDSFINQANFISKRNKIISNYFGPDVPYLISNITSGVEISSKDEVLLLTKEKEVQSDELVDSALKIQRENLLNQFYIGVIILIIIIAIFTYRQYYLKVNTNKQLKEQKNEIEKQNEQLVNLNEEKNNLISILAHDLRAPINSIDGLVKLLSFDPDKKERIEILDKINTSTTRLNGMIKKILDVESIESDDTNLNIEEIDIKLILEEVLFEFNEVAKHKKIQLITHKVDDNLKIKGDRLYLLQVFENLVSNALKFSDPGTDITLVAQKLKGKVICSVKDQGPGISKEDKKKLYKKFQKLSAKPTEGEQSTGLGLSIVKKYVELMDGKLSVKSELGHGAEFIVEFNSAD